MDPFWVLGLRRKRNPWCNVPMLTVHDTSNGMDLRKTRVNSTGFDILGNLATKTKALGFLYGFGLSQRTPLSEKRPLEAETCFRVPKAQCPARVFATTGL